MEYKVLVEAYEKLERVSAKLEKTRILAELFLKTPDDDLPRVALLAQGIVFPKYTGYEVGIATQMMIKAIAKATGFSEREVEDKFRETGDLGTVAENFVASRRQITLFTKKLTVEKVFQNLQRLAFITGPGSQDRKLALVTELLSFAEPKEAKYIVRTILGELRIGIAEGIIRDAIAHAFLFKEGMSKEEKNGVIEAVDYAWNILSDFGEVIKIAKEEGVEGLKNVKVQLGKPIQVMLAEKAPSLKEALSSVGKALIEVKYDGARLQIHKKGDKIWLFTRRLENVTKQFPDVVEMAKKCLKARECIVEGECVAIDPKTGERLPFQRLSQRIQRKYEIERMVKEIPTQVNLFDIVYLDGKMLFNKTQKERRKILESVVNVVPGKFQLTEAIVTDDLKQAEEFYRKALEAKQEGVMVKNPNATYMFGRHVGGWWKVKPIMETLDLVIIGAEWGTGKRANWLGSYVLGCRDPETGKFLECGMMGTGIKEKKESPDDVTFEDMTEMLKPLIEHEEGRKVKIKPKIVVEVAYEEIQESPNYTSGFALRFPRFVRLRVDKGPEEADTIERVKKLFLTQRVRRK